MAWMTARYCLWTIFLLIPILQLRADANELNKNQLRLVLDALRIDGPFRHSNCGFPNQRGLQIESMLRTDCDLFARLGSKDWNSDQLSNSAAQTLAGLPESDLPPRPSITLAQSRLHSRLPSYAEPVYFYRDTARSSAEDSATKFGPFSLSMRTGVLVVNHRRILSQSQLWVEDVVGVVGITIQKSVKSTGKLVISNVMEMIPQSPSYPTVMSRVSHSKVIHETSDMDSESTPEFEETSNQDSTSEVIQIEDSADPYWRYYEDCDRWGVNFVLLLNQANSFKQNEECDLDAHLNPTTTETPDQYVPISVPGVVGSQILATRLSSVSKSIDQLIRTTRNWGQRYEFHAVELESVDPSSVNLDPRDAWVIFAWELSKPVPETAFDLAEWPNSEPGRQISRPDVEIKENCIRPFFGSILRKIEQVRTSQSVNFAPGLFNQFIWASSQLDEITGFSEWAALGSKKSVVNISTAPSR